MSDKSLAALWGHLVHRWRETKRNETLSKQQACRGDWLVALGDASQVLGRSIGLEYWIITFLSCPHAKSTSEHGCKYSPADTVTVRYYLREAIFVNTQLHHLNDPNGTQLKTALRTVLVRGEWEEEADWMPIQPRTSQWFCNNPILNQSIKCAWSLDMIRVQKRKRLNVTTCTYALWVFLVQ